MGRTKREPQAQREAVRTGPPADPTTILTRLTPEERGWFIDVISRLVAVEIGLEDLNREPDMIPALVRHVRMAREFLDQVIFGHPKPGCAHRETPVPETTRKK